LRKPQNLRPCGQGGQKIQLPYTNKFETIWEYQVAFFSDRIDFLAYIGPVCPICGDRDCYQEIDPYWRYAIDLFPDFKKEEVPVARFLCQKYRSTFSLLPIQLIPYFQYTVSAVIGTLFLGVSCWRMGQAGFCGAEASVDSESNVTAWLVIYWLMMVVTGLRRGHGKLMRVYDLSCIQTSKTGVLWQELVDYFVVFGIGPERKWRPRLHALLYQYSYTTRSFLFGTPSQHRSVKV